MYNYYHPFLFFNQTLTITQLLVLSTLKVKTLFVKNLPFFLHLQQWKIMDKCRYLLDITQFQISEVYMYYVMLYKKPWNALNGTNPVNIIEKLNGTQIRHCTYLFLSLVFWYGSNGKKHVKMTTKICNLPNENAHFI